MLVDSHCHLTFPELHDRLDKVVAAMKASDVGMALCVSVDLEDFALVRAVAARFPQVYASVGIHPDNAPGVAVDEEELVGLARDPRVIAIGETGLDYYRLKGDLEWQRERFRTHIRAARRSAKPLIIHTRAAAVDTLRLMREESAGAAGGVMHCFTESWEVASAALDLGFHISFSGIVTFKNATELKEVAKKVPLDRLLVETDAPYLAPVPHRGKPNEPAYVRHVAEYVAQLRSLPFEEVAAATTRNFLRLFRLKRGSH
ncbi:MAG: TatD family hydrolase [Betaproteobacteria bacterium]|nr:TatD family hydrolase [Betaproteobacteria bacterium]